MQPSKYSTIRNAENVTRKHADSLAQRLYVAAEKAGFRETLASMRVGVIWSGGKYVVDYEPEVREAGIEINHEALDRAQTWLDKATAR